MSEPQRFRPHGDGLIVSITEGEADLLRSIPGELRTVLEAPPTPDDPVGSRLFPRAYLDPTQEDAEREWQELVRPELVRERVGALERLTETLDRAEHRGGRVEVELSPDDVQAWLGMLNDARLALGTRLGVTEELDDEQIGADHPETAAYAVYGWLTWLEGDLIETLLG